MFLDADYTLWEQDFNSPFSSLTILNSKMKLVSSFFILVCLGLSWREVSSRYFVPWTEVQQLTDGLNKWAEEGFPENHFHFHHHHKRQAEQEDVSAPAPPDSESPEPAAAAAPTENPIEVATMSVTPRDAEPPATTPSSSFFPSSESIRKTLQDVSDTIRGIATNVVNVVNDVVKAVNKIVGDKEKSQP